MRTQSNPNETDREEAGIEERKQQGSHETEKPGQAEEEAKKRRGATR